MRTISILITATELWGAQFLWVQDLSQPDSIFTMGVIRFDLMLILMGATQFWQAWLTPSPDPQQRTMALVMPMVMVVMMYMMKFSAALVLYWTIGNIFTIVQTYMTHKPDESAAALVKPNPKLK